MSGSCSPVVLGVCRTGAALPAGTGVTGPDGTVSISFTVPVLLPEGSYQVQLTAGDGEETATSFALRSFLQDALAHLWRLLGGGH